MDIKKTIFFPDGRFIWIFESPETLLVEDAEGPVREIPFAALEREMWGKKRMKDKRDRGEARSRISERRYIRLRDAPSYLGMDPNRFNDEVRPHLTVIPIGKQGVAFDRIDLDAWAEQYKARNGRPAKATKGGKAWDAKHHRASSSEAVSGILRRQSEEREFFEALELATSRKRKSTPAFLTERARQVDLYGERPQRTFRQAATKYLREATKASLRVDATQLRMLDPFIGDKPLSAVHMGSLQAFMESRRLQGVKNRTINYALQVARHILNLAASDWMDDNGLTWLHHAPKIKLLPERDKRRPYPLSRVEQERLFDELPAHLRQMALYKVNTGCREQEVCGLRWEWEVVIPELGASVFIIPAERVKNRDDRLVILNKIAMSVVNEMRGTHPERVFSYEGNPVGCMNTKAWRKARNRAGLPYVRVHDLKHTFGHRLRDAGVSFEDIQDLLGHRSSRITDLYSRPSIMRLVAAANKVCDAEWNKNGTVVFLKARFGSGSIG